MLGYNNPDLERELIAKIACERTRDECTHLLDEDAGDAQACDAHAYWTLKLEGGTEIRGCTRTTLDSIETNISAASAEHALRRDNATVVPNYVTDMYDFGRFKVSALPILVGRHHRFHLGDVIPRACCPFIRRRQ